MNQAIRHGSSMIAESRRILVFTGAGLSTESGIPDFRSPGGLWDKYDPSDFYFDKFLASGEIRERYWRMSSEAYAVMRKASPNKAHLALHLLEKAGKLLGLVTQNIDRLHHKAGNSPDIVLELHGTTFFVSCLFCGASFERDEIEERRSAGETAPRCKKCGGLLKPATVSFGQAMPQKAMSLALEWAAECDLCIVLGSSLVVYPAASVPIEAGRHGAPLIIINRDETPMDDRAELVIHGSVTEILGPMVEAALRT
ncbi:MAG: Sir2 family NAD-dependent protein deacetylase [Desulfatiglandaceae bacterium]